MKEANAIKRPNEFSKCKCQSNIPYNYWRKILSKTLQSIPNLPNGIWFILACFAAPTLGIMSVPKVAVISLTLFVIFAAIVVGTLAYNHIDKEERDSTKNVSKKMTNNPAPPEEPKPMNNPQIQSGPVNAPNNQGNINTGLVSGNLSQSVIVTSPLPRVLADPQDFVKLLTPFAGSSLNIVEVWNGDGDDVSSFSQQIRNALTQANVSVTRSIIKMDTSGTSNLHVLVSDPSNPPALASALLAFFKIPKAEKKPNSPMYEGAVTLCIAAQK